MAVTIQWYATEGYIPKPEKVGAEAFYAPSAQISSRIRVIQTLQKRFELKLREIKVIVEKQAQSDWETIYNLLTALQDHFPYTDCDFNGNEYVCPKGSNMAKIICHKLKVVAVDEISLADAEEEYDRVSNDDPEALNDEMPF